MIQCVVDKAPSSSPPSLLSAIVDYSSSSDDDQSHSIESSPIAKRRRVEETKSPIIATPITDSNSVVLRPASVVVSSIECKIGNRVYSLDVFSLDGKTSRECVLSWSLKQSISSHTST